MGCSPFKGLSLTDSGKPGLDGQHPPSKSPVGGLDGQHPPSKTPVRGLDGQHPPSKTPVGRLPWTCQSEGKCQMTEKINWWAEQPSQVACFSEGLKC